MKRPYKNVKKSVQPTTKIKPIDHCKVIVIFFPFSIISSSKQNSKPTSKEGLERKQ